VFAFGGVYPVTLLVPAAILAVLAVASRPPLLGRSPTPRVDLWSIVAVGAMLLQIVPLPRAVLAAVDPAAEAAARALLLVDPGGLLPISIDPSSTAGALLLFAGVFLCHAAARHVFNHGGVRAITRLIAVVGLVLSGVAIAQSATGRGLMYWRWKPLGEGPDPFGPFVNRNHFATWAVMAIPLLAGYLTAHASAHHGPGPGAPWRRRVVAAMDTRVWMLLGSTTMLIVALAASLSRSGLLGLAAALACGAYFSVTGPRRDQQRSYAPRSGRAGALIALLAALAMLAVATEVGPGAIADRFDTSRGAVADRLTIWHDTLPVMRDFWLTGTGAGTYPTSMAIYQRSKPGVIFNQAHNHYLQLAAEGGVLVGLPILLALSALVRATARSLEADRSAIYWIRAGAAAGLVGVAVQSVWETGLTIPANAALAAVLAAIAVHAPFRAGVRA
jgi:hypothetical protein